MDIKEFCLAHEFDMSKCAVASGGGSFEMTALKTSPVEFLCLAEDDFERGGLSALVNATTNAKRAIVCQLDQLLISFGYPSLKWNVPKKIEKLRALGLLAPSLLRKVVNMRNLLEHEYETPEFKIIEEALDIASLFVMSASAMFIPFEDVLEFSLPDPVPRSSTVTHIMAGLNREDRGTFYTVYAYEPGEYYGRCVGQCEIQSGHVLFEAMVKLSASLMLRYKVNQALKEFETAYAQL
ncbi:hypothetical protein GIW41_28115 [Pseudomonas sp. PA-6-1D]|uniref:hypothetical protein n=1 Tax=unclassified Pseudomonas TaxID=196821 RepID=UPI001F295CD3|nr:MULTISPECIES: hypothetical protein [unclassified Pseudomonas]MCF5142821.1 hypothetical protein [Pseudomonas sp. PA-6-3C]MCF5150845.1 hypothetical protein [Pseudomonas sp. PA-6-3F]MCF5161379.1 hypothetical protein [Pseudomonas sp. PA-6-2E]MCF5179119.1 hypothetical protein [Pseudomonas sp. PA-6-1D]MCF5195908.1 hypothetical protein [Pseudomonas sp. PA-6-1H]